MIISMSHKDDNDDSTSRMVDDNHPFDTPQWTAPLPSLPSCPSWWQLLQSGARSGRKKFTRRISSVKSSASRTINLPILPHTTLVSEILPFCDDSTLMAFRGVSKQFREIEIPREFHYRAMNKIESSSNEKDRQKQKRQHSALSSSSLLDPIRYSFKKKVVDEQQRKVWVFLRDNAKENKNETAENETGNPLALPNTNTTFDSHSDIWSMETVTSKVLKLIRDIEFYNGSVYGYDQDRARDLLLQKGWIDDRDFEHPQMCLKSLLKKNLFGNNYQEEYPVYGKWRAEASVRDISLNEALEILSDKASMDQNVSKTQQQQRHWKSFFSKTTTRKTIWE